MENKNIIIIVMAVMLGVCFASCGDDKKDELGEEIPSTSSSSIIGTWRNSWGDDSRSYTAYSFFDDGTGLMFDKGNGAERFTYIYNKQTNVVSIEYNEYQKEQMTVSKLTSNALVLGGDEYKKTELTHDMLILGEWYIHVDPQNSTGKGSRVMFYCDGTYEAKDYVDFDADDEWYYAFGGLKGKVSGTYTITNTSISIKGQSQIAGNYIIDGLVVNGCRLIRASNPNEYPYLLGGWHNR